MGLPAGLVLHVQSSLSNLERHRDLFRRFVLNRDFGFQIQGIAEQARGTGGNILNAGFAGVLAAIKERDRSL